MADLGFRIELWSGIRTPLRALFELADDSASSLDSSMDRGEVLVARAADEVRGHLQLVGTQTPTTAEILNMAVRADQQGRGIGRALVQAAVERAARAGCRLLVVSTAAASTGTCGSTSDSVSGCRPWCGMPSPRRPATPTPS